MTSPSAWPVVLPKLQLGRGSFVFCGQQTSSQCARVPYENRPWQLRQGRCLGCRGVHLGVEAADLCAGLIRSLQLRVGSGLEPLSRYKQAQSISIVVFLSFVNVHTMVVPSSVAQYCPNPAAAMGPAEGRRL